jgi:hypothetical protein
VKTEDPFKDNSWRHVRHWTGSKDLIKTFDNKLESLIFQAKTGADMEAFNKGGEVLVRHRMSKEIAEELLRDFGDSAFVHVLERLESNNTVNRQLWRDVLAWMGDSDD